MPCNQSEKWLIFTYFSMWDLKNCQDNFEINTTILNLKRNELCEDWVRFVLYCTKKDFS